MDGQRPTVSSHHAMNSPNIPLRVGQDSNCRPKSRFGRSLERSILRFVQKHSVLRPGERVVAGVSGGPDSTLLIRCLAHLQDVLDIHLSIAHYDHGLRSRAEAQDDSDYVAGLAKDLDLPFTIGRGQVRKEARARRLSVEEAARRLRYAFLAAEARRLKAQAVTVGHTSSDQAETVLLHIMRGSGLRGVAAMLPRSGWPTGDGPDLIRPLLDLGRDDILRYCAEEGIKPCVDPSNSSLNADRNRVRLQLMPELSKFNPQVERALCRLATAATIDSSYLDAAAEAIWPTLATEKDGVTILDRPGLVQLERAIAFRVLRLAARRLAEPTIELTTLHLTALAETLHKQRASVSLPGALMATLEGNYLLIARDSTPIRPAPTLTKQELTVPGQTSVGSWLVEAKYSEGPYLDISFPSGFEACLDAHVVGPQLVVRSRCPGDWLRPLGLSGKKKVQDLLVDAKIPARQRGAVPLVCAPWGIVWVVGHRIDERAAIRPTTGKILHLRFKRSA